MFIDSHCHLDFEILSSDICNIIERAKIVGVTDILTIATCEANFDNVIDISNKFSNVWGSIGVHPHSSEKSPIKDINTILQFLEHPKIIGIGETGLDYYYQNAKRINQIDSLHLHCQAAHITKLPIIIHNRNSDDDMIEILTEHKNIDKNFKGVIHCFTATKDFAYKCIDMGFYISFSGILTFKNSDNLRYIAKEIPLDRILIETDAPYLAPVPHRGKTNEPSFIIETAKQLCSIHDISMDTLSSITNNNFQSLFHKFNPSL